MGRFADPTPKGFSGMWSPPFDTTKPNIHDSKAEFVEERDTVERQLSHAHGLFEFLASQHMTDEPGWEMAHRVCKKIDEGARLQSKRIFVDQPEALIRSNAALVGITTVSIYLLKDIITEFTNRRQELADQEVEFWSGQSRPPNHYARTIALRFARLVAGEKHLRPTVGAARDGSHPSTDFGRAIEEIFEVLEIKANYRRAAEWAVDQLTEEEIAPPVNVLGSVVGLDSKPKPTPDKTRAVIEALLKKGADP